MKRFVLGIITITAGYLLLLQLQQATAYGQSPTPISGPITRPITYFKIVGRVTVRWSNPIQPLAGIKVVATNISTQARTVAYTDTNGYYGLPVVNGTYFVRIRRQLGYRFIPWRREVTVTGGDVTGVDFQAKLIQ